MDIDCVRPPIIIWTKEDVLRDVISSILCEKGIETKYVYDNYELFSLLEDNQPSIVILDDVDDGLPKILGFEIYEIINRIERFNDTKVILISSTARIIPGVDDSIDRDQLKGQLLPKIMSFIPSKPTEPEAIKYRVGGDIEYAMQPETEIQVHEEVKRFARIIVSDIFIYNKDKAERGVKEGTFYELLKDEIEEGRRFYSERVPASILITTNYFDEAIQQKHDLALFATFKDEKYSAYHH